VVEVDHDGFWCEQEYFEAYKDILEFIRVDSSDSYLIPENHIDIRFPDYSPKHTIACFADGFFDELSEMFDNKITVKNTEIRKI